MKNTVEFDFPRSKITKIIIFVAPKPTYLTKAQGKSSPAGRTSFGYNLLAKFGGRIVAGHVLKHLVY